MMRKAWKLKKCNLKKSENFSSQRNMRFSDEIPRKRKSPSNPLNKPRPEKRRPNSPNKEERPRKRPRKQRQQKVQTFHVLEKPNYNPQEPSKNLS